MKFKRLALFSRLCLCLGFSLGVWFGFVLCSDDAVCVVGECGLSLGNSAKKHHAVSGSDVPFGDGATVLSPNTPRATATSLQLAPPPGT